MSQTGFFISFEGSEGCGKSTQIRQLIEDLRRMGQEPVLVREPGGTPIGEHIRHLLQHAPEGDTLTPEAELLLFAAGPRLPDVTFLLDIDPEAGFERLRRRAQPEAKRDRMEEEPLAFYEAVRQGYLAAAAAEPDRIHVLDASQPESEVAGQIRAELQRRSHVFLQGSRV